MRRAMMVGFVSLLLLLLACKEHGDCSEPCARLAEAWKGQVDRPLDADACEEQCRGWTQERRACLCAAADGAAADACIGSAGRASLVLDSQPFSRECNVALLGLEFGTVTWGERPANDEQRVEFLRRCAAWPAHVQNCVVGANNAEDYTCCLAMLQAAAPRTDVPICERVFDKAVSWRTRAGHAHLTDSERAAFLTWCGSLSGERQVCLDEARSEAAAQVCLGQIAAFAGDPAQTTRALCRQVVDNILVVAEQNGTPRPSDDDLKKVADECIGFPDGLRRCLADARTGDMFASCMGSVVEQLRQAVAELKTRGVPAPTQ